MMLFMFMSCIFFHKKAKAQCNVLPIGTMTICQSDTRLFSVQTPLAGYTYTWAITPSIGAQALTPGANATNVFFANAGTYTISVVGTNGNTTQNSTCTKAIIVTPTPNPTVSYDKVVGCQLITPPIDNFMPADGACLNFCAGSTVNFTATSQPANTTSTFQWVVTGGTATSYTVNPVAVTFNTTAGPASIKVIETNNGCVTEKLFCIDLINKPIAKINTHLVLSGVCYDICLGQVVNFEDASFANGGTALNTWLWNFGDGTTYTGNVGSQSPPPHLYAAGNYTATLQVINACNCASEVYKVCFNVNQKPSPPIFCTRSVCKDGLDIYCTNEDCGTYIWSVVGGNIFRNGVNMGTTYSTNVVSPAVPDNCNKCIEVKWNAITSDGFGYVTLAALNCQSTCANPNTVKIPIIGSIVMPNIAACAGDKVAISLPQWPATNFTWSIFSGSGALLSPLTNGNTALVEVSPAPTGNQIKVKIDYVSTLKGCTGILYQTIDITAKPQLSAPNNLFCNNVPISFTLSNVTSTPVGTGQFVIIGPSGTYTVSSISCTATTTTNVYTAILPAVSLAGNYLITFIHPSYCASNQIAFKILAPPPAFASITGEALVCDGLPYPYSANSAIVGTIGNWTVTPPLAAILASTANTNNILWSMGATVSAATIAVNRSWSDLPSCASASITQLVNKIIPFFTATPVGPAITVCENSVTTYSITTTQATAAGTLLTPEVYKWYLGDALKGSIVSGQGTAQVQVAWNKLIGSPTVTLKCDITICGTVNTFTYNVTITGAPILTAITPSIIAPVCSGVPVTFTATNIAGATYSWAFSDGTLPTSGGTTNVATCTFTNLGNVTNTITYTVTCTNSCGSSGSRTATYTVKPQPNSNIAPAGPFTFCTGATFLQIITITTANGAPSLQWSFDDAGAQPNKNITGATGASLILRNSPFPIVPSPLATTSEGAYTCLATLAGCTTLVGPVNVVYQTCATPCTPLAPAGISAIAIATAPIACLQASGTAIVTGTIGTNIFAGGINWGSSGTYIISAAASTTSAGTSITCTSPTFNYAAPGIYTITIAVNYKDAANTALVCVQKKAQTVIIPIKAAMDVKWVCNGTNTGYDLVCKNTSSLLAGVNLTSTNWKKNGVSFSTASTFTLTGLAAGTYTIDMTAVAGTGAANTCTATTVVTRPSLPIAGFTALTTHPLLPNSKSCEGREIMLTNTSTVVAPNTIDWVEWSFGDGSKSNIKSFPPYNAVNKQLGKVNPALPTNSVYILTVKDAAGCTNASTQTFSIVRNWITSLNSNYNNSPQNICLGILVTLPIQKDILPLTNAVGPFQFNWKNLTMPVPPAGTSNSFVPPLNMSGAYWVKVSDADNCFTNFNPGLAVVTYQQPITITISAKTANCMPEPVVLKAINASSTAGVTYTWNVNGPGGAYVLGAGQSISDNPTAAGSYTYTCTASGTGLCSGTANIVVTVNAQPAAPVLEITGVVCQPFSATLAVNSPQATGQYNWSNGTVGAITTVVSDDFFRCWYADANGCRAQSDILVPASPDQYLWRMPYGCERMCREYLPVHVDGPDGVVFDTWEWQFNGIVAPMNGPYLPSGSNTTCDPLWVDEVPNGNGSGAYSWQLGIPYITTTGTLPCVVVSNPWDISITTCCNVPMTLVNYNISGASINYTAIVTPSMGTCVSINYQILLFDASNVQVGNIPMGTISNNVASTLSGTINLLPNAGAPYTMQIRFSCLDCVNGPIECNSTAPLSIGNKQASTLSMPNTTIGTWLCLPNPANNQVQISYNLLPLEATNTTFSLLDIQGKTIMQQRIVEPKGEIIWNTTHLANGMYQVVQSQNNKAISVQKLIIAH
jgi:PKD repeat protein